MVRRRAEVIASVCTINRGEENDVEEGILKAGNYVQKLLKIREQTLS